MIVIKKVKWGNGIGVIEERLYCTVIWIETRMVRRWQQCKDMGEEGCYQGKHLVQNLSQEAFKDQKDNLWLEKSNLTSFQYLHVYNPGFDRTWLVLLISYLCWFSEKAMAPHSSTLAWKIPWMEEPGGLQSMVSLRVGHDWATSLSFSLSCLGEGNGNPLQCSCLENPRDGGAWWAAVFGVTQSRTRLKRLSSSSLLVLSKVLMKDCVLLWRLYPLLKSYLLPQCCLHLSIHTNLWIQVSFICMEMTRRVTIFTDFFSLEPRNHMK